MSDEKRFEQVREVIREWKAAWRKQPDYATRAHGIDANMQVDLANRIAQAIREAVPVRVLEAVAKALMAGLDCQCGEPECPNAGDCPDCQTRMGGLIALTPYLPPQAEQVTIGTKP